ncbi:MAG: hypothetical protein M3451_00190 [Chloroflexota bacterium]|nr:hypothetical protein [Chloroflexota bacterium]
MTFDRRSRNAGRARRRRQPSDPPGSAQDGTDAQASRRRTSYVPRQGSGQARRVSTDQDQFGFDEASPSGPARRVQQPPYRRESQDATNQYDYYEEPDDDHLYQDEPLAGQPRHQNRRRNLPGNVQRGYELDDQPQQRRQQPQPQGRDDDYTDAYGDSFIDEDDWYEEEVAAGAARPRATARARGRRARSAPRPSMSMPRPNIPRPAVPRSVREAALVQDQNALILFGSLLVSMLLLALFTSNRIESLAPGFATHISASGIPESIRSESALWQLPLMAGALLLMNVVLAWFLAQRSRFLSRFFLVTAALVQVLIWVAFLRIAY